MGSFPNFSNIADYTTKTIENRKGSVYNVSKLNAWIRVTSAVSDGNGTDGLVIVSNPDYKLFGAAGVSSIYGNLNQSGTIGETWTGKPINPSTGKGFRPNPVIENIQIDEGAGNLSRKANFSVKCFSKEQLNLVTTYFQEPGFTIFLEWGWNTIESMYGLVKELNADNIAQFQNFKKLTERREASSGQYDNYLGYITGGSIANENTSWIVDVKCTGFTELPAYLINGDGAGAKNNDKAQKAPDYRNLGGVINLNKKRWQFAFNALPSNRKTYEIKALGGNKNYEDDSLRKVPIKQAVNYINFDETITDSLNSKADGTALGRAVGVGGATQDGDRTAIPSGTQLVGSEKFIRFGTLMKIFNQMIIKGVKIGKKTISMKIHSDTTLCSAYPRIFSTDKGKLFIPNPQTPKFSLIDARKSTEPLSEVPSEKEDCSVEYKGTKIQFPAESDIIEGTVKINGKTYNLNYKDKFILNSECITKDKGYWGLLDDLYVNFDFASSIMSNSNLVVKDALYQILNGMSSAVNDLWNFQIMETTLENDKVIDGVELKAGDQILQIKELNFTYKPKKEPYTFTMEGVDSVFKDASLAIDMGGAKMNQIIGTRLATKINKDTYPNMGKLFAKGYTDLVLKEINSQKEEADDDESKGDETDEELKEKNYANFLGKLGSYPRVEIERKNITRGFDVNTTLYVSSFDDSQLLKLAKDPLDNKETNVSILLPLNFNFTIHGVSGIKRGDRFKVKGIPEKYYKQGFFQVLGVTHEIQNMEWVTKVEGGYRNANY